MAPDHMEVTPKATRKLKFEAEFLDIFWALADIKDANRIAAAEKLLQYIEARQSKNESPCEELLYTIKRLVKGLASSRKSARPGFAVALTQLLRRFDAVPVQDILNKVEKYLKVSKRESTKQEHGSSVIGQAMAYLAIIQSGSISKVTGEQVEVVARSLLCLGGEKSYVNQMCTVGLVHLASKVSPDVFKKFAWPVLESVVSCGWETCRPDCFMLVLGLIHYQPDCFTKKFLSKHWGSTSLISENNFTKIYAIMKASINDQPVVHDVCLDILREANTQNILPQFWHSVVDEKFCTKDAPTSRKYACLQMVPHALRLATNAATINAILSKNVMDCLMYNIQGKDRILYSAARTLLEDLEKFCKSSTDGKLQVAVLTKLLTPPGSIWFDKMTKTRTVISIVSSLTAEGIKEYGDLLMDVIWGEPVFGETKNVDLKMKGGISQLRDLITSQNSDPDWQLYAIKFILIHAYFKVDQADKSRLQCGKWCESPLTPAIQISLQEAFFKALTNLATFSPRHTKKGHKERYISYINVLHQLVLHAQNYIKGDVPLLQPFSGDVSEAWSKMVTVVEAIQSKHANDKDLNENHAFVLLFLHLGLQLFHGADSAMEALEELHMCYEKASKRKRKASTKKDGAEEPSWVEVVTDLLVSLQSQSSNLVRVITKEVLSMLRPHITRPALQLILAVFKPADGDEESPLAFEDDEDEDEEGEEDSIEMDEEVNGEASDNEADSGSSSESEEEEEDEVVDEAFRASLKAALGDAAADEEEESADEDMDDDAMFRLDPALAEVFRHRKVGKFSKVEKEKYQQLVQFKNRCLDLLLTLVNESVPSHLLVDCVMPLLELMHGGFTDSSQMVVAEKAKSVFKHLCSPKLQRKLSADPLIDTKELLDLMNQLVVFSTKVSDTPMVQDVSQACLFVLKLVMQAETAGASKTKSKRSSSKSAKTESSITSIVGTFSEALEEFFHKRDSRYSHLLFHTVVERQPVAMWSLSQTLLSAATNPELRVYVKTQALSMLAAMVTKDTVHEIGPDRWSQFVDLTLVKLTDNVKSLDATSLKPRYVHDMLLLMHNVLLADPKQVLPKVICDKLQEISTHLKKDCKKLCTKLLSQNSDSKPKQLSKRKVVGDNVDDGGTSEKGHSPVKKLRQKVKNDSEPTQAPSGEEVTNQGNDNDVQSLPSPHSIQGDQITRSSTKKKKRKQTNECEEKSVEDSCSVNNDDLEPLVPLSSKKAKKGGLRTESDVAVVTETPVKGNVKNQVLISATKSKQNAKKTESEASTVESPMKLRQEVRNGSEPTQAPSGEGVTNQGHGYALQSLPSPHSEQGDQITRSSTKKKKRKRTSESEGTPVADSHTANNEVLKQLVPLSSKKAKKGGLKTESDMAVFTATPIKGNVLNQVLTSSKKSKQRSKKTEGEVSPIRSPMISKNRVKQEGKSKKSEKRTVVYKGIQPISSSDSEDSACEKTPRKLVPFKSISKEHKLTEESKEMNGDEIVTFKLEEDAVKFRS